jgi:hypothetical protein
VSVRRLLGSCCVGGLLMSSGMAAAETAQAPTTVYISAAGIVVDGVSRDLGDTVISGTPTEDGCNLPSFKIAIKSTIVDTRVSLSQTAQCHVVISAVDLGSGEVAGRDETRVSGTPLIMPVAIPLISDAILEPRGQIPRSGETKFTILEQFGITAYEAQVSLSTMQDLGSGDLGDGQSRGYCYASAFPGNEIESCNIYASHHGSYIDTDVYGQFDNNLLGGPGMYLLVSHTITETGLGGFCELLEGDYPPLWSGDCQVRRHN